MKTGLSKYYPQNTSFETPFGKAEIFWQTNNANHLLENYTDNITQFGKHHDLKFVDFKHLLQDANIHIIPSKYKKNIFETIAYSHSKKRYYFIIFALEKRFKNLFAVIITAYATKKAEHINKYKES